MTKKELKRQNKELKEDIKALLGEDWLKKIEIEYRYKHREDMEKGFWNLFTFNVIKMPGVQVMLKNEGI